MGWWSSAIDKDTGKPAHIRRVQDTKPPHNVIHREKCTCDKGQDHSEYGHKEDYE